MGFELLYAGFETLVGWDRWDRWDPAPNVPGPDSKIHLETRCCAILISNLG